MNETSFRFTWSGSQRTKNGLLILMFAANGVWLIEHSNFVSTRHRNPQELIESSATTTAAANGVAIEMGQCSNDGNPEWMTHLTSNYTRITFLSPRSSAPIQITHQTNFVPFCASMNCHRRRRRKFSKRTFHTWFSTFVRIRYDDDTTCALAICLVNTNSLLPKQNHTCDGIIYSEFNFRFAFLATDCHTMCHT